MNSTTFLLSLLLVATGPSLANPSTVHLSCNVVVRQYGPRLSDEPINETMDVTIEGAGKTLRITSTGKVSGAQFYGDRMGRPDREVVDRSTDAIWDVTELQYAGGDAKLLFYENRLVLNRYTASIRIEFKSQHGTGAVGEGTCKRHAEKQF